MIDSWDPQHLAPMLPWFFQHILPKLLGISSTSFSQVVFVRPRKFNISKIIRYKSLDCFGPAVRFFETSEIWIDMMLVYNLYIHEYFCLTIIMDEVYSYDGCF